MTISALSDCYMSQIKHVHNVLEALVGIQHGTLKAVRTRSC